MTVDQPGGDQAGAEQPGADQAGTDRPGTDQPQAARPGAARPRAGRPGMGRSGAAQLAAAVRQVLPSARADLDRLVRIPSVSADPAAAPHLRASAAAVAAMLRLAGLPAVEVLCVEDGQPAVLGRRPGPPGAPAVLLYAHHDVQPPGDRADWDSDPFQPTVRDGRLYARGAADDKAGIAVHLAALRAHGGQLPVGVTVLVEGEEEIGSPTLPRFLAAYRDRIPADVVVLADSANWTADVPALTTSLRGGVNVTVQVRTLRHGVHSGLYGGPVPDALTALCRLLATLHDECGDVAVAGLTRGTAPPLGLTEERLRADSGLLDGVQLIGSGRLTERLWACPAIAVIGIDAPPVQAAANTLVPAARAKVSMRVAPGDDAARARAALASHLESHAPWGVRVTVESSGTVAPYRARAGGNGYRAAHAALADAWGTPAVDVGVGGSLQFVTAFAEFAPDAEILITGVEDPDTRAHGANESLHLAVFERACLAEALLLRKIGETG
jgi:acetylornithine deacetylase/succinyl-diaminopimelate desuccinylase-like protein